MQEKDNILRIFRETKKAINNGDYSKIRELSNQTINVASHTQDPDNIAVAVIVYSIGKIFERTDYQRYPGWKKYYQTTKDLLDSTIKSIEKNDENLTRQNLNQIRESINKLSGKLKEYIQDVFRKASINKAAKIYEHGISMETTAKLLGISLWELAGYAGSKEIETPATIIDEKSRIKLAMGIFE